MTARDLQAILENRKYTKTMERKYNIANMQGANCISANISACNTEPS